MPRSLVFFALFSLLIDNAAAGLPNAVRSMTLIGGSGEDDGLAIARDSSGRIVLAGATTARDIPADTTHSFGPAGAEDIFVARLAPDGSRVESVTYIGGTALDEPFDVAIDASGGIVIAGYSASVDFPTVNAVQTEFAGGGFADFDGVIVKLTAAGDGIVYSTYFGGLDYNADLVGNEFARAVQIDAAGNAWITGETGAPDFPVTQVFNARPCLQGESIGLSPLIGDAWLAKFGPDGELLLSTCIGGTRRDVGRDIEIDAAGNVYLNGHSRSDDFPVTPGAYQTSRNGLGSNYDGFVMKLNGAVSNAIYSTYVGGTSLEFTQRSVLLPGGGLLLAGTTYSTDFPVTPNAPQTVYGGGDSDAVLFSISADGSALTFATYLGGPLAENGFGLALDRLGRRYLLGDILPNFSGANRVGEREPGLPGLTARRRGMGDDEAFMAVYRAATPVFFSSFGGTGDDISGFRMLVDDSNQAWFSGTTTSPDFPLVDPFQDVLAGASDGFLGRIVLDADGDGIADNSDNCLLRANTPQRDTDADGYGNACDPDLDNNGIVNFLDLQLIQIAFFSTAGSANFNPNADFNADNAINFVDLLLMQTLFFGQPGPSAQAP